MLTYTVASPVPSEAPGTVDQLTLPSAVVELVASRTLLGLTAEGSGDVAAFPRHATVVGAQQTLIIICIIQCKKNI